MKSIVIVLLSILFLNRHSNAQTVFAPQGAVWNYYLDNDGIGTNFRYEVEKDTIYGGRLCSKINSQRLSKSSITDLNPVYFCTSGDTVLYYHDSLKTFTPLYIFNVKVGDTLALAAPRFFAAYLDTARFRVIKVETTIIDGLPLRTVYTETIDFHYFLNKYTERVGAYNVANIFGFDATKTAMHTEGIRCYRDKEIEEQFYSDKWDCDYVPNNIDEKAFANDIRIYPNPAHQQLFVEIAKHNAKGQIQLLGLDGRVVNQQKILEMGNKLDLSSISNGLYFLTVSSENERISKLISIIH